MKSLPHTSTRLLAGLALLVLPVAVALANREAQEFLSVFQVAARFTVVGSAALLHQVGGIPLVIAVGVLVGAVTLAVPALLWRSTYRSLIALSLALMLVGATAIAFVLLYRVNLHDRIRVFGDDSLGIARMITLFAGIAFVAWGGTTAVLAGAARWAARADSSLALPLRLLAAVPTLLVAGGVAMAMLLQAGELPRDTRHPCHYLIPDGYVGWLRIDYDVSDAQAIEFGVDQAPPLPVSDGARIHEFPPSGRLVTSSPFEGGRAKDEYFYVADGRRERLSQAHDSGMVWGASNGIVGGAGAATQTAFFFIGTRADFDRYGNRGGPVPAAGPITR